MSAKYVIMCRYRRVCNKQRRL